MAEAAYATLTILHIPPMYIELSLPEGTSGDWEIRTFYEGDTKYQALFKSGILMMANTFDIVEEYVDFLSRAEGTILINGLGIGMCCQYLLKKPSVTALTVVEFEPDAIKLVAPYFKSDLRFETIQADALTFQPPQGVRYDYVWHDIWTQYRSANLESMDSLFEKYRNIAGWQGAWAREKCITLQCTEQTRSQVNRFSDQK